MRVVRVDQDRERWRAGVQALERGVTYPIGDDRFEIDHGEDYFAFFDRLGELVYYAVVDEERVVAVAGAVMRQLADGPAWYACDLKVHPDYRGRRLGWRILLKGFPVQYPRCGRGYGVSMNPGDGSPNPMIELLSRWGSLLPNGVGTRLLLYSLDQDTMREVTPLLTRHRGPVSYLSLQDSKGIVLQSSGQPMPLLHVQFGPFAAPGVPEPLPGHVHMFCTPEDDPLVGELGLEPSATATVVHHRMKNHDWSFILTSDI
jgi:GNAT superfamily N-acetyltransferase